MLQTLDTCAVCHIWFACIVFLRTYCGSCVHYGDWFYLCHPLLCGIIFEVWISWLNVWSTNVLVCRHSYVKRLSAFCHARGSDNLGLPSLYHIQLVGLPGAASQTFESWAVSIVDFKPKLIIVDLGDNDVACSSCPVAELAAELLLHLCRILDHLPACLFTQVVILEQHKCNRVPSTMVHYSLYKLRLWDWHMAMAAFARIDECITFQRLRGSSRHRWYRDFTDGVHLNTKMQWAYLSTLQYVIRMAYHA